MSTTLAVIGAGPAGYPAAFHAADLGMNVTLIDTEKNPGGVCLYRGCIPSKALLHAAALIGETRDAAEMGLTFAAPEIDLEKLRGWKQGVVDKLTGGLGALSKGRRISFIQGRAAFVDAHTLEVAVAGGGTQKVSFDYAIVATGSEPVRIPIAPDSPRVMDSTGALALEDIPKTMLVVGGGYIGLELGQVYAALGSRVSVVEMMPGLLPGADRELVKVLEPRLRKQFERIMTATRVTAMEDNGEGVRVGFEGDHAGDGQAVFDRVLVSVGRRPTAGGLGLENTRVQVDAKGFVVVDAQRRTAEPSVFAVGDVAGQPMLAHKGTAEARVAVDAIAGRKTVFDPAAIPAVVFTDPELAWCGLTTTEAEARGVEVETASFPWAASGRATTLGRGDGVTRLLLEPATGRVLGVGMTGHGAGELIAEGVLAIEMGAVAEDLACTIHPHPTLSETVMEAAEAFEGQSTHFMSRKKK
jgi:dihydrolipoamide dehydrogenase